MKFKVRMRLVRDVAGDFVVARFRSQKQAHDCAEALRAALKASPNTLTDFEVKVMKVRKAVKRAR